MTNENLKRVDFQLNEDFFNYINELLEKQNFSPGLLAKYLFINFWNNFFQKRKELEELEKLRKLMFPTKISKENYNRFKEVKKKLSYIN